MRSGEDTRAKDTMRLKRREQLKTILLLASILSIWGITLTGLVYGTNVTGMASTAITGNVVVGGDVYYKSAIGGLPSGSILMFTTACPSGWTRQTVFDGRYIRIATTANSTGGASTHTHTFSHTHDSGYSTASAGSNHQHGGSGNLGSAGGHLHTGSCDDMSAGGGYGFWQASSSTSIESAHTHYFIYSTGFTNAAHTHAFSGTSSSSSPAVNAANNDPTRISVVVCKKN